MCAAKEARRGSAAVAPPDAAGKLTPEMLALFSEAQRNIMELNKSRLAALGELRAARQRIQELGAGETAVHLPALHLPCADLRTTRSRSALLTRSLQAGSVSDQSPRSFQRFWESGGQVFAAPTFALLTSCN